MATKAMGPAARRAHRDPMIEEASVEDGEDEGRQHHGTGECGDLLEAPVAPATGVQNRCGEVVPGG